MLGLIYIFATAKPISMRRLSMLFVLVLISASLPLRLLDVRAPSGPLLAASSVTLFVWITPLLRATHAAIRRRALSLAGLWQVSGFVRWTYGFAIAAIAIVAVSVIVRLIPRVYPAAFAWAVVTAAISVPFLMLITEPLTRKYPENEAPLRKEQRLT